MHHPTTQLDALKQHHFHHIDGKFHSHITVNVQGAEQLDALRQFCRARKVKLTVIDLEHFDGRQQRDVMTTQHYRIEGDDAVHQIIDQLTALVGELKAADYDVVRVKLEHESLPTLPVFGAHNYREVHIKLRIEPDQYDQTMRWLKDHAAAFGYVPSNNPNERKTQWVTQFINLRLYEGTLAQTDQHVDALVDFLTDNDVHVAEVKRETTVFDTNLDLDHWWT